MLTKVTFASLHIPMTETQIWGSEVFELRISRIMPRYRDNSCRFCCSYTFVVIVVLDDLSLWVAP